MNDAGNLQRGKVENPTIVENSKSFQFLITWTLILRMPHVAEEY